MMMLMTKTIIEVPSAIHFASGARAGKIQHAPTSGSNRSSHKLIGHLQIVLIRIGSIQQSLA